jgi:hypothetical protein
MWLCVGLPHPQYRIAMHAGSTYTAGELLLKCESKPWPCDSVFMEYMPNAFIRVKNQSELDFACELVARYHSELCQNDGAYVVSR